MHTFCTYSNTNFDSVRGEKELTEEVSLQTAFFAIKSIFKAILPTKPTIVNEVLLIKNSESVLEVEKMCQTRNEEDL